MYFYITFRAYLLLFLYSKKRSYNTKQLKSSQVICTLSKNVNKLFHFIFSKVCEVQFRVGKLTSFYIMSNIQKVSCQQQKSYCTQDVLGLMAQSFFTGVNYSCCSVYYYDVLLLMSLFYFQSKVSQTYHQLALLVRTSYEIMINVI